MKVGGDKGSLTDILDRVMKLGANKENERYPKDTKGKQNTTRNTN